MTLLSSLADCWLGLCRKTPVLHSAAAVMLGVADTSHTVQPDAGGAAGGQGRIRNGISLATRSIRAMFHDRKLLVFSLLSGLVILFLIAAEGWTLTHYDHSLSTWLWIPFGDATLTLFDLRLFLIEVICLSGFTLLLAALVCFRNAKNTGRPVTFRKAFTGASRHAGTLAALSVAMALVATLLLEITAQNEITGMIEFTISMALFWLPYAYYFPPDGIFSALFFSFRMMVANIVLFLLALYVIPVIVLEGRGLLPALAGSARLMQRTWQELLGCIIVLGIIVLAVAATGLLIGQSPSLLNNDYDFFLQESRGMVLMAAACYGFLFACGVMIAMGLTVLEVAATDLYEYGKMREVHTVQRNP